MRLPSFLEFVSRESSFRVSFSFEMHSSFHLLTFSHNLVKLSLSLFKLWTQRYSEAKGRLQQSSSPILFTLFDSVWRWPLEEWRRKGKRNKKQSFALKERHSSKRKSNKKSDSLPFSLSHLFPLFTSQISRYLCESISLQTEREPFESMPFPPLKTNGCKKSASASVNELVSSALSLSCC